MKEDKASQNNFKHSNQQLVNNIHIKAETSTILFFRIGTRNIFPVLVRECDFLNQNTWAGN